MDGWMDGWMDHRHAIELLTNSIGWFLS